LYVGRLEVDNISPDGKVFFLERGHKYYHIKDITNNKVNAFNVTKFKFRSPTGILAGFKDGLEISAEELRAEWAEKAKVASDRGSKLHAYCESIYDGWDFGEVPQEPQARHAEKALKKLASLGWKLAKTELLVYNLKYRLAGQVDLLLRKKIDGKTKFGIFDYKFLKEPIQKKSFYNQRAGGYKMMFGPFKYLMDCNYYHYSIQMEIYRMLMGKLKENVIEKSLVVMTEDNFELVEGYAIEIWIDKKGILQAKYKKTNGQGVYDSSRDKEYLKNPYRLID